MANAITNNTQQFTAPYLTVAEYKSAPTSIDYDNLVVGGNSVAQDAELSNVILRASSWIDQYTNQILGATADTEQQRVRVSPDGTIRFHPKNNPIIALTSFSYGGNPNQLTTATDCSIAWIEDGEVIFPYAQLATSYSDQGALQFGFPVTSKSETFLRYTYVNGYANTTVNSVSSGASSVTVASPTGIVPNQMLKIYDGAKSENVTVASNYTYGSNTVLLASTTLYSHQSGISISALPAAVKEACILVTTSFLKVRGDNSLVMAVATSGSQSIGSQNIPAELKLASDLLKPFRRIR